MNQNAPDQRGNVLVIAQFFCFALLGGSLILQPFVSDPALTALGFVVLAGGVVLAIAAIAQHGFDNRGLPSITPSPDSRRELVTGGVYRFARHPIYSGVILSAIGVSLIHGQLFDWLITAALIVVLTLKTRHEERLLKEAYGEYDKYMAHVGRFSPWL